MTAIVVTMPRLSDSMEEGTVSRWLVGPGEDVEKGQPLVEIDTDKATVVYEAEASGTLLEIVASEGDTVALGAPIARIGDTADAAKSATAPREDRRANASPVARRLASELGIDLASVTGTGPSGIVTRADVEKADRARGRDGAPVRMQELTRMQETIARRLVEGASAPTFSVEVEIDMTEAVALRRSLAAQDPAAPSLNDVVVKAVALALRDFPRVNGSYSDGRFELHERVNVGIAVATDDGLVVPVVHDADRKPLAQLATEAQGLAAKARDGSIAPADLEGGTFTVTNLGMLGARSFVPILNPPQAAILSVGAVAKRPVVALSDDVTVRELAGLTIVCDHRIVYGAEAARFLARLRELLEQPAQLAT